DRAVGPAQRRLLITTRRQWLSKWNRMLQICKYRRCHDRYPRIERWIGVEPMGKIILQIVMNSETGPHRPSSRSRRVPSQTDSWLQEQFRVIFNECRVPDPGFSLDDVVDKDVIGSVSVRFVPPIRHLIPQSQFQRQTLFEFDFVLHIPGCLGGAEV